MPAAWAAASASAIWMPHAIAVFSGSGFRLRFLNEASPLLLGLSLASVVRGQELQRGAPVQQDVAGLVDHAHSAFPELFLDFVVADGAPGHRRES